MGQGLQVCKPCGDSEPFDFVVLNVRRAMNRMQMKSAWRCFPQSRGYKIENNRWRFNRSGFDFLVVVLPEVDTWYVIPADDVHLEKAVWLYPGKPNKKRGMKAYEQYREAWHLLTGDEPGAWARYQRFTIHANAE